MELNLHPIATKCFVSGREFVEDDRIVSYLVRPYLAPQDRDTDAKPLFARYDLLEGEDLPAFAKGDFTARRDLVAAGVDRGSENPGSATPATATNPAAGQSSLVLDFVYCRWVTDYKPRKDDNSALALKLTAENLFLTLALAPGSSAEAVSDQLSAVNTPLLQFLALMMERKRQIKLRGYTEDGQRQIYEHMASHQMYEVPVGDLNVEFFQKIQEHLGVLVGTPKVKAAPAEPVAAAPAVVSAETPVTS